jgi:hypothetical protein
MNIRPHSRPIVLAALVGGCALSGACAGHSGASPAPGPESRSRLEVVNRSDSDMDIYLNHAGQHIRLGLAPNDQTTRFALTPSLVAGLGPSRFEAVPLAGMAQRVTSDPVVLTPTTVVTLDIPPP